MPSVRYRQSLSRKRFTALGGTPGRSDNLTSGVAKHGSPPRLIGGRKEAGIRVELQPAMIRRDPHLISFLA
ncbi:hypothetical protein BRADI_4g19488v3 [Brachypodium distachyon]|uniref:Uncharacterized protein n=1 Tax=Brachypodium distachyon TaxID=15368 RepID=A0A2K2CNQ1_BRADI|nr:hypothetical protein BRADI_4g19488v3 [Brachypodium distachyon]